MFDRFKDTNLLKKMVKNKNQTIFYPHMIDLDSLFEKTFKEDHAFVIDENIDYKYYLESRDRKTLTKLSVVDSIFSYKFGITKDDDPEIMVNIYTCKCGHIKGTQNMYKLCPICNHKVNKFIPKRLGWFISKYTPIIHPFIAYLIIEDCGEKEVRKERKTTDKDKKRERKMSILEELERGKNKKYTLEDVFLNGKLYDFLKDYLKPKHKEFADIYKDYLYVNHIPVINKKYRQMTIDQNYGVFEIQHHTLNQHYFEISYMTSDLNSDPNMITIKKLQKLMVMLKANHGIMASIFGEIASDKKQYWRSEKYGKRYLKSARAIIDPITDPNITDISDVQLSIDIYRTIFSKNIEEELKKMHYDVKKIHKLTDVNYKLNEKEKELIRKIFKKIPNNYIYINREPSIYMTSILGVRIHSLVDEMVLKLSSFLLLGLAGDYDGDALGIITWDDPLLRKYVFESFNIKNSLVDTLDIKFTGTAAPHNTFGVQMYLAYGEDAVFKKIE